MQAIEDIKPLINSNNHGAIYKAFGDEIRLLISGAESGGKFTLFVDTTPPGGGPPLHYHENEDECFYVLEGKAEFYKDSQWIAASAGSSAFMPKGCVHTFRNCGDVALKLLVHASPAGFEIFFSRCAEEFKNPNGPDMQRIMQISAEHGINFVK